MTAQATSLFERQNIKAENMLFVHTADIRYMGQEHAVTTPMAAGPVTPDAVARCRAAFDRIHEQKFTFSLPEAKAEFVGFSLTAYAVVIKPEIKKIAPGPRRGQRRKGASGTLLYEGYGKLRCRVYDRARLGEGDRIEGPAIVEESKSVTVLCPRQTLTVDAYGNLIINTAY